MPPGDDTAATMPPGLCGRCARARRVRSGRGPTYYRCGRADGDAAYARYPRLPVMACAGYESEAPRGEGASEAATQA